MADVKTLIADMVKAGVDPDLIGRTAEALSQREAVLVPDEAADRRRAADRERKRLRNSAEVVRNDDLALPRKESPQTPKETTPTEPTTPKENPLRGQKKAVRLPSDFAPDLVWAVEQGLTRSQAEAEAAKFRDYWTAKGRDAAKVDWPATWRNWVRSALERTGQPRAGPSKSLNPTLLAAKSLQDEIDAVTREIEGHHPPPRLVVIGQR